MFTGFLLSESNRINSDIKAESWEARQEKTLLDQLITGLYKEIGNLKRENRYLVEENKNCSEDYGQAWQSNTQFDWEVIELKASNRDCITGLEQCVLELTNILK